MSKNTSKLAKIDDQKGSIKPGFDAGTYNSYKRASRFIKKNL